MSSKPNKYGRASASPRNQRGGMDMNKLMAQAQALQEQMAQAQEQAKDIEASSSAGGGMVKVTASGDMRIKDIAIDPEAIDPDDVELLQDMILAAVNGALEQAEEAASQQMNAAAGLDSLGGLGGGNMGDALSQLGLGGLF